MRAFAALFTGFIVWLAAVPAMAGDTLLYGPAPSWVKSLPIPEPRAAASGPAEILLHSRQERLTTDAHERYVETALKVLTPQGLDDAGRFVASWDPALSDLTIVKAEIIRDGKAIDLLAGDEKFTVLRREQNLSIAVLDGALTAIFEAKGLRVGDIVHLATWTRSQDPVLGAHRETAEAILHRGVIGRLHLRQVWAKDVPLQWKATPAYSEKVKQTETAFGTELEFDQTAVETPEPPEGAPGRFAINSLLQMTDYRGWSDISRQLASHYMNAARLKPDSPLKAEAEKIRAQHRTQEAQALAALRLVEHDVRYLALVMNAGGLVPAVADDTWTRRFGDCKGKTVLLIALLNELGVQAEPALVASEGGEGMDEFLPRVAMFDHVIVRAQINGRTYWLDGTRPTDRSLESLSGVPYAFALPVRSGGADLEKIERKPPAKPLLEDLYETDIRTGVQDKVPSRFVALVRGDRGMFLDLALSQTPRADAEKGLKELFEDDIDWLDVEKVNYAWDEAEEGLRVEFSGKGRLNWRRLGSNWNVALSNALDEQFDERKPGLGADAPYTLAFPYYYAQTYRVLTPEGQVRRDLEGDDVELTTGGVLFSRKSKVANGVAETTVYTKVLQPEVSAAEAMASNRTRKASPLARMVSFTYGAAGVSNSAQEQVAELIRLADANLKTNNPGEALSYLDKALRLDPKNPELLLQHFVVATAAKDFDAAAGDAIELRKVSATAQAYLMEAGALANARRYREAATALNQAEKLNASAVNVARARAAVHAGLARPLDMIKVLDGMLAQGLGASGDLGLTLVLDVVSKMNEGQRARFVRALQGEPQSPSSRLVLGALLMDKEPQQAVEQFSQALLIHKDFPEALRRRATARAKLKDLRGAGADIDQIVALNPNDMGALLLKAQFHFDNKNSAEAVAAYDAVIKLQPANASLYNQRCWTRATADLDLEKALEDCNEALRLRPNFAAASDSRGLVNLRLKRADAAIADYNASLVDREFAGSLYGRGLAKQLAGDKSGAEADLARARELDPNVHKEYEGYGLKP